MPLRPEEVFVRDCLIQVLGGPEAVSARDGENPPDFYLSFNGTLRAVEVSRLAPVTFKPSGKIGNRLSDDSFGISLCDSLNKRLGPQIPDGRALFLNIRLPVKDATRFRPAVRKLLEESVIIDGPFTGTREFRVMQAALGITWVPQQRSGKKVVGIAQNEHADPDILLNATVILCERLGEKEELCSRLNPAVPRWLGLLNDYWLADAETYAQAYARCQRQHSFERIYLVSDTSAVALLHAES